MRLAPFSEARRVPRAKRSTTSRYSTPYQITDGTYTHLPSYVRKPIPVSDEDVYHPVSSGDAGKLDLISFKYYATPYLWWVIALANNIQNPLRVPQGTRLRIPSLASVSGGL